MKERARKPPMKLRPIYVQYVSQRLCRNNPSYDRFASLPRLEQNFLWTRWRKRRRAKTTKTKAA